MEGRKGFPLSELLGRLPLSYIISFCKVILGTGETSSDSEDVAPPRDGIRRIVMFSGSVDFWIFLLLPGWCTIGGLLEFKSFLPESPSNLAEKKLLFSLVSFLIDARPLSPGDGSLG